MAGLDESIVFIRDPGSTDPVPDGWEAAPLSWRGRAMEVVFDPARVQVASVTSRSLNDDHRRRLPEVGWRQAAVDGHGIELWLTDRARAQVARLDRLAAGSPVAAPDALAAGLT
ncbi:MAG: hypothetical protein ACRD2C_20590 [Acidimicrobiales bacterium]